ncbi:MAG: hypothetical protein ACN6OB_22195 [Chryseobacterium jejuense]|uniref:hypothetical protein n=1 Tax=Chryseobacterium jejuense TaxID=445960 RepID=UPI003D14739C
MKTAFKQFYNEIKNKKIPVDNPCGNFIIRNESKYIETEKDIIIRTYFEALISTGMPEYEAMDKAQSYLAHHYDFEG